MSLPEQLESLTARRQSLADGEVLGPWLDALLRAARDSAACGLDAQAGILIGRMEDVLGRLEARQALDAERAAMTVEVEWSAPEADAAAMRQELSEGIRTGKYALPLAEIPILLERLGVMTAAQMLELRGQLSWRRLRWLRTRRRPWFKPRPKDDDLPVGLYNSQGVTGDVLETAASVAPLWVDDLLEQERHFGAIDRLLGLGGK